MEPIVVVSQERKNRLRWLLFGLPLGLTVLLSQCVSAVLSGSHAAEYLLFLSAFPLVFLLFGLSAEYAKQITVSNGVLKVGAYTGPEYPLSELLEVYGDEGDITNDFREHIVLKFADDRQVAIDVEKFGEEEVRKFLTNLKRVKPDCKYSYSDVISLESRGLLRFLITSHPVDNLIIRLSQAPSEEVIVRLLRDSEPTFWAMYTLVSTIALSLLTAYGITQGANTWSTPTTLPENAALNVGAAGAAASMWTKWWLIAQASCVAALRALPAVSGGAFTAMWIGLVLSAFGWLYLRTFQSVFTFVDELSIGMGGTFFTWETVDQVNLLKPSIYGEALESVLEVKSGILQPIRIDLGRIPDMKRRQAVLQLVDRYAKTAARNSEFIRATATLADIQFTDLWLAGQDTNNDHKTDKRSRVGTTLQSGKYTVDSILGYGGQGITYLANVSGQQVQKIVVVIKEIVLPMQADVRIVQDATSKFQRGASLLSALDHEHVVHLLDHFIENGKAYMVLNFIPGRTIRQIVQENGIPGADIVKQWGKELCEILTYLHGREPAVVHCDLAPDNLIVTPTGKLVLVDFDVARVLDARSYSAIAGRPGYTPPEQFRGNPSKESDIFALGGILYFMLKGEDPPPLLSPDTEISSDPGEAELVELIRKCLSFEETDRPRSANAVKRSLEYADARDESGIPLTIQLPHSLHPEKLERK